MPVVDDRLNAFGDDAVKLQRSRRVLRDIGIRPHKAKPNLDVIRHGPDAVNLLGGPLRREFAGIRVDEASQRHHTALGCNADSARVRLRLPVQLPHDGVPYSHIRIGHRSRCHRALLHPPSVG